MMLGAFISRFNACRITTPALRLRGRPLSRRMMASAHRSSASGAPRQHYPSRAIAMGMTLPFRYFQRVGRDISHQRYMIHARLLQGGHVARSPPTDSAPRITGR